MKKLKLILPFAILILVIAILIWPTYIHFISVNEPIDVVYTWVDGSDLNWINLKNKYNFNSDIFRFTENNELKYSLISVQKYAPWINKIYIIVADIQKPSFVEFGDRIKLIKHSEIIPNEYLPVFNSLPIEACLHHIKSLNENFLYFNDDMFLGNVVSKQDIFNKIYYIPGVFLNNYTPVKSSDNSWISNQKNNYKLLADKFGNKVLYYITSHQCYFCKRSLMYELENMFPEAIKDTLSERFRKNDTSSLIVKSICLPMMQGMYGIFKKIYTLLPENNTANISMNNGEEKNKLIDLLKSRPKFFCINNSTVNMDNFFKQYFNVKK